MCFYRTFSGGTDAHEGRTISDSEAGDRQFSWKESHVSPSAQWDRQGDREPGCLAGLRDHTGEGTPSVPAGGVRSAQSDPGLGEEVEKVMPGVRDRGKGQTAQSPVLPQPCTSPVPHPEPRHPWPRTEPALSRADQRDGHPRITSRH